MTTAARKKNATLSKLPTLVVIIPYQSKIPNRKCMTTYH